MAELWYNRTAQGFDELPTIGSTVVVKYTAGANREYQIIEIKTGSIQMQLLNDTNVVAWQYIDVFLSSVSPASKKLLSGYKEGADNDWAPAVNGYLQTEYDINMLRQQINARLQTLPNEVDGFDGVDYINVIFGQTSVEQKATALVDVIKNIPTVKDVTFLSASWVDKVTGIFQFNFEIQSIFGDLSFQLGLDAQNRKVLAEN